MIHKELIPSELDWYHVTVSRTAYKAHADGRALGT